MRNNNPNIEITLTWHFPRWRANGMKDGWMISTINHVKTNRHFRFQILHSNGVIYVNRVCVLSLPSTTQACNTEVFGLYIIIFILSDGHTIATTSRRPMTTDTHRQPITDQIFDRQSVADQLQTSRRPIANHSAIGRRLNFESSFVTKSTIGRQPFGDWLPGSQKKFWCYA